MLSATQTETVIVGSVLHIRFTDSMTGASGPAAGKGVGRIKIVWGGSAGTSGYADGSMGMNEKQGYSMATLGREKGDGVNTAAAVDPLREDGGAGTGGLLVELTGDRSVADVKTIPGQTGLSSGLAVSALSPGSLLIRVLQPGTNVQLAAVRVVVIARTPLGVVALQELEHALKHCFAVGCGHGLGLRHGAEKQPSFLTCSCLSKNVRLTFANNLNICPM